MNMLPPLQSQLQQALALHQQGRLSLAKSRYEEILHEHPRHFASLHLLGVLAAQSNEPRTALALFDRALEVDSSNAVTHFNRGTTLQDLQCWEESLASYGRAVAIRRDYPEAHFNLGVVQSKLRRWSAARTSFDRVLALKPGQKFLPGLRRHVRMHLCEWDGFDADLIELTAGIERDERTAPPFLVLGLSGSATLQRRAAEIWVRQEYPARSAPLPSAKRIGPRIRIGYFSSDFHDHATAYLIAELLELHDRSRFEIIGLSFGADSPGAMRKRLAAACDDFIDVRERSDPQIAMLSRDLGIDIAADLKGFTEDSRPGIFAHRAAPIQIGYLGYPGTMGAEYIDYLVADHVLIPPGSRSAYREKIIYLPHSYQVNDAKRVISDRLFTREELGLPRAAFVFCCFNKHYKITPEIFAAWMRILGQVPGSVLWLLAGDPAAAENLRRAAAQRHVSPERLVFAGRMPLSEHLARHRAADLFIDTLPCNAHTTASDALWAGLPVLTCAGEAFSSRVAASLLTAVGLPELVTTTLVQYEQTAIALASDPQRLDYLSRRLADQRLTAPLFDSRRFTQNLEAAYTTIHDRCRAGLPPEHWGAHDAAA